MLLGLRDPSPAALQQAKFTFYRCAVLLHWPLRHTVFCSLAWERGLSARHFLWTWLVRGLGARPGTLGCSWAARQGGELVCQPRDE